MLPDSIDKIVKVMPLSYCVSMMRTSGRDFPFPICPADSLVLLCVTAAFTLLTAITFKWD